MASWVEDPFVIQEGKRKWKQVMSEDLGEEWVCAFPSFPNSFDAHFDQWKWWFEKYVSFAENELVLVGHSLGGNFLAKYLAEHTSPVTVAQLHLVAPSWNEGDFVLPGSLSNIDKQCKRVCLYYSQDDEVVPPTEIEKYVKALPQAEVMSFDDRGHFLQEEFPELIANIQGN